LQQLKTGSVELSTFSSVSARTSKDETEGLVHACEGENLCHIKGREVKGGHDMVQKALFKSLAKR
jgi:hypothetical protein